MCMAISFKTKSHYFGRNLDLEMDMGQEIIVTPRNYPFKYLTQPTQDEHLAIIGMGIVSNKYPLYFDATNERGLSMAGLNFPRFASYKPRLPGKKNIAPFEFIPWILSKCATVAQAKDLIRETSLLNEPFDDKTPLTPLHWMIADKNESIVVEQTVNGMNIRENPVGVLTNSPAFPFHMLNLANYMNVSAGNPENRLSDEIDLKPYSRGLGAMGLPGDLSSASRFVRGTFTKLNSVCGDSEEESVTQFFHIMDSTKQTRGCCDLGDGKYEYTVYTSCCNTEKGIYYYKTYGNSRINAVSLRNTNPNRKTLYEFPLNITQDIQMQN